MPGESLAGLKQPAFSAAAAAVKAAASATVTVAARVAAAVVTGAADNALNIPAAAARHGFPLYRSLYTSSGNCLKSGRLALFNAHRKGLLDDCPRQRVLAPVLQRICHRDQVFLREAFSGNNISHAGPSLGDRSGLVQHHGIDAAHRLQCLSVLEKDAAACALSAACHYCDRRCKAQSAGTGDHQHGNCPLHGVTCGGSRDKPARGRYQRQHHHQRHENARDPVRDSRDRGLGRLGVRHHPYDLGQRRVAAHSCRSAEKVAGSVDRRGAHRVIRGFFHRNGFSRKSRFVNGADALENHSVRRNRASRLHRENIPRRQCVCVRLDLDSVPHDDRAARRQLHQLLEGVGGPAL